MEFTVEFYQTTAGRRPVEEFLLKLKASDPDDFAARSQTLFGNALGPETPFPILLKPCAAATASTMKAPR
jgi:hypothetical protein